MLGKLGQQATHSDNLTITVPNRIVVIPGITANGLLLSGIIRCHYLFCGSLIAQDHALSVHDVLLR